MTKQYATAKEVAEALGVSEGKAYGIIRELNAQLRERGYITISGKGSRAKDPDTQQPEQKPPARTAGEGSRLISKIQAAGCQSQQRQIWTSSAGRHREPALI